MFNGIEIDMLSLGDADAILLTEHTQYGPFKVLIDGGNGGDSKAVADFLKRRDATGLYAIVNTHTHNDHARGLINLINEGSVTFATAWMHNIRNHASREQLRRASSGSSAKADEVKQILEITDELTQAFMSRGVVPQEPFAGMSILPYFLNVLGPTKEFYQQAIEEATEVDIVPAAWAPLPVAAPALGLTPLGALAGTAPALDPLYLSAVFSPRPMGNLAALAGILSQSSVEKDPTTQPFNNTSTILGMQFGEAKYLFTGDAGADALDKIPFGWRNLYWMQVPHHGSDGNLSQSNIERFCPRYAFVSAKGGDGHPSRAIVNGLKKVGTDVFSTHRGGDLWHWNGSAPSRFGYSAAIPL